MTCVSKWDACVFWRHIIGFLCSNIRCFKWIPFFLRFRLIFDFIRNGNKTKQCTIHVTLMAQLQLINLKKMITFTSANQHYYYAHTNTNIYTPATENQFLPRQKEAMEKKKPLNWMPLVAWNYKMLLIFNILMLDLQLMLEIGIDLFFCFLLLFKLKHLIATAKVYIWPIYSLFLLANANFISLTRARKKIWSECSCCCSCFKFRLI